MSLSVRVRFEVFKRDRFTCAYCGRTPPGVLLEVDHITPRAAGGSDEIENLTTSCWECNHGKGARLLEEGIRPLISSDHVAELQERVDQARAYAELSQQMRELQDRVYDLFLDHWADAFGAERKESNDGVVYRFRWGGCWPDERSVRRFLGRLPMSEVLDAADATSARFDGSPGPDACRYFYAICWRKIKAAP